MVYGVWKEVTLGSVLRSTNKQGVSKEGERTVHLSTLSGLILDKWVLFSSIFFDPCKEQGKQSNQR